jgi:HSP20 family protein
VKFQDWDPIKKLEELHAQSNRLWDEFLAEVPASDAQAAPLAFHPDVDFVETDLEFRCYLAVPGLLEDDILIEIGDQQLVVRGERKPPYDIRREKRLQEWRYGYFERTLQFAEPISRQQLRVSYEEGVLIIVAPKATGGSAN